MYCEEALSRGELDWGVCAVGALPRDADLVESLRAQDGLYTLIEIDKEVCIPRIVGAIVDTVHSPSEPEVAVARMAAESTRIVTLTITESGYGHDPSTGRPYSLRSDFATDLGRQSAAPVPGMLVDALARRMTAGLAPFTVLSCDNIASNGDTLRTVCTEIAAARSGKLAEWLAAFGSFPNSMVDRITPATTAGHVRMVQQRFGIDDAAPVVCEPFRQWVIEDKFTLGRPRWQESGVQFVTDVGPYEIAKLRLLNVAHSALAYPALLDGFSFVHEAASDIDFAAFVGAMLEKEVTPTLREVPGIDTSRYRSQVLERFRNAAIADRLDRICSDGSRKLGNQLLPILRERIAAGAPFDRLAFTVASWLRYLAGHTDRGEPFEVRDPLASELRAVAALAKNDIAAYIDVPTLFPPDLAANRGFVDAVGNALRSIASSGARAALKSRL